MDIMTLTSSDFKGGKIVNGIQKAKWVERWQQSGEFELVCDPLESIQAQLALGTVITHMNTAECMIVEDHEIDESQKDITLRVTGRSLTGYLLDNRSGSGTNFGKLNPTTQSENLYEFNVTRTLVNHMVEYLREQIQYGTISASDTVSSLTINAGFAGSDTPKELIVKRGQFASEVEGLLKQMDAGLIFARPLGGATGATLTVSKGTDRSTSVVFSTEFGDLENTRYFWTNRNHRNSALVVGKYYSLVSRAAGKTGIDMRVMYVDASDYDFDPSAATSLQLAQADRILQQRADIALAKQRAQSYLETDITPNNRWRYRTDYNIGDTVLVKGRYGVSQAMRVVEYAEFNDETGDVGVPTVKPVGV